MAGKTAISFCGCISLLMVIATIVIPIVLIQQLNNIKLNGPLGTAGTPFFVSDNQTITLSGVTDTTQMTVYRWDLDKKNKTSNNTQEGLMICFDVGTDEGVIAYLRLGSQPPTTTEWASRMYAPKPDFVTFYPCFPLSVASNCGGSLYIGLMANSTYANSFHTQNFSLRVTRDVSSWCEIGKGILMAMGLVGVLCLAAVMGCFTCCCCVGWIVMLSNYRKHHHTLYYTRVDVHNPVVNQQPPVTYPAAPTYYQQQPQQQPPVYQQQQQMPGSYPQQLQQQPPAYSANPSAPLLGNNPKLHSVD